MTHHDHPGKAAYEGLSDKHRLVLAAILTGATEEAAWVGAGYGARGLSASANCCRMLKRPEVVLARAWKQSVLSRKSEITAERVLRELAVVAFFDIGAVASWEKGEITLKPSGELPPEVRAGIAEVSEGPQGVRLKAHPKVAALRLATDVLGLRSVNVNLTRAEALGNLAAELGIKPEEIVGET